MKRRDGTRRKRKPRRELSQADCALIATVASLLKMQKGLARHLREPHEALLEVAGEDTGFDRWLKSWASLVQMMHDKFMPAAEELITRPCSKDFSPEARRRTAILIDSAIPMFEGLAIMSGAAVAYLSDLIEELFNGTWPAAEVEEVMNEPEGQNAEARPEVG